MKVEDTSIPRFKLATINKKDKYLLDLDSHKFTWLIPMSTWYVANNATKISEDQYIKLRKVPKNKVGASIWSFSGFMLGGVIYAFMKGLESIFFEEITMNLMVLAFLIAFFCSFIFRYIRSVVNLNKLKKIFNEETTLKLDHFIVLKKDNTFYKKRCVTGTIILIAILVFLLSLLIQAKSLTVIPVIFIYLVFVSFLNTSIVKPMENMEYSYKPEK